MKRQRIDLVPVLRRSVEFAPHSSQSQMPNNDPKLGGCVERHNPCGMAPGA